MENLKHVVVDDGNIEGLFIMTDKRKNVKENRIGIASLERVYKRVRMWDDNGDMYIRDYTESEWNGTSDLFEFHGYCKFDDYREQKETTILSFNVMLAYMNYFLRDFGTGDFLSDLDAGYLPFEFDELPPAGKDLINKMRDWNSNEPLGKVYGKIIAKCIKIKDGDGTEFYEIECFDRED